ncbi:DUF4249 domain-containing protein [Niastella sp. OAS944]|uniref:DUF4249 domain-containing protein n=1 Tax=Niastella sp. OAS944 TaxID=2664089 RepID=UPI0035C7E5A6|nr:hypothetical protein [Chitinophagaceae bacterium OAS944]
MRILLFILFVVVNSSCEKTVNIPLPNEANKLVLNLIMNKDSIMMARVTISERMNNYQSPVDIKNAVVNLYENGTFKETLTQYEYSGRFYYRSNTLPLAGATYKVTASVPGYTEVSGSDYIPDTVQMEEIRITAAQSVVWLTKATIAVQWHDDPDVQNYYRVRIYDINEWMNANGSGGRQKIQHSFEAEEATLNIFSDKERGEFYTTDALFNGRSPRFTFKANTGSNVRKMIVEVSSLTYNSYNYLNSSYMAREKSDDGFSEKVIVFNNIENGLGIVGGVAQREYILEK